MTPKTKPVTSAPPATPMRDASALNMKPRKKNSSARGATTHVSTA
jgi:hypothetical protein